MKSRIPIPLMKLLKDKQTEKLKEQYSNKNQAETKMSSQAQEQNQDKDEVQAQDKEQDQSKSQNQRQGKKQGKSSGKAKVKIKFKDHDQTQYENQPSPPQSINQLFSELRSNMDHIKKTVGNSSDIVIRDFQAGKNGSMHLGVIYTDGLTNSTDVQDFILDTLMFEIRNSEFDPNVMIATSLFELIKSKALPVGEVKEIADFEQVFHHVLSGDTVLLIDKYPKAIALGSRKWADRGIQEPTSQTVVRGPKDGFSETLRLNTALIRRRIKDPNLWLETKPVGTKTKTDVAIMYLKGVADDKTVAELKSRLNRIDIDGILESGYIEEFIQDEVYTPFPTVYNTERPDTIAAGILEGRIAILVDGTPFALLVPALLAHFFQSSEDYYQRADIATLIRMLRYLTFFLSLLTPSLYVAVTTFHQEMLPTALLISLASQREGVPFPALVEALLMEFTFEILREAGLRMPRAVGASISIVGALVIGQAAVEAGIVSASMVIVVAFTAICSFVTPSFSMAISIRILRFLFMILAATFGLFGIILGLIVMVLHLNSIRSFGIPYLTPNAPFILQDQKDNILRLPVWALKTRPRLISQKNIVRDDTPSPKPSRQ